MPEIAVKVIPGSRTEEIRVISPTELHVKIRARPVEGQANSYLILFLSKQLGIARSAIVILKGEKARMKKLFIDLSEIEWVQKISSIQ